MGSAGRAIGQQRIARYAMSPPAIWLLIGFSALLAAGALWMAARLLIELLSLD